VATILDTYMTLIKKKITEIESIVNKADNRKTAGKIYLPKDWIGKKVKTVLLSSLIVTIIISGLIIIPLHDHDAIAKKGLKKALNKLRNVGKVGANAAERGAVLNQALLDQAASMTAHGTTPIELTHAQSVLTRNFNEAFPTPEDFLKWRDECKAELGLSENDLLPLKRMIDCTQTISEADPSVLRFIESLGR
jgi:hypothetical protein